MVATIYAGIRRNLERRYSHETLKKGAFIVSLILCLLAGSIILFSVFATAFHDELGLSYLDCNTVALFAALAMYAPNAFLGFAADTYGPPVLCAIALILFWPSYLVLAVLVDKMELGAVINIYWLAACFSLIGMATLALYFGSVLTCAKIYPQSKGFAISLPVTCFGLSLLLGSQLMKRFTRPDGSLQLSKVFWMFAWLYLGVGIMSFLACSVVVAEQEVIFEEMVTDVTPPPDEETPLVPQRLIEPKHHKQRLVTFLKDPLMWLMMVLLISLIGPLELFQNNLGSIVKKRHANLTDQVLVMAAASTVARLVSGAGSDYLSLPSRRYPICRVWFLAVALLIASVGQAAVVTTAGDFSPVLLLNGVGYGLIFTLFPTLACEVWGVDFFGTSWGTFMIAPAVGTIAYSMYYGHEMDLGIGLEKYFSVALVSLLVSAVVLVITWRVLWAPRGFRLF